MSESQLGSTLDMKIMPLFIEGKGRRRLLGNKIVSCVRSDDMPPNLLSLENRNVEVKLFGRVSAIQSWLAKGRTGAYPVKKEKRSLAPELGKKESKRAKIALRATSQMRLYLPENITVTHMSNANGHL